MPDSDTPIRTETDADVIAVSRLEAVQLILRVLSRSTGLRMALVARVTEESWTACAVLDNAGFGLKVGDQLDLQTTY
ncbi:MAG TPA: hypothetical protein VFG99_07610 [Chloroflexia bacterium]|nr:hypothetical protein [Chloroflexia bacterium]HYP41549.1 hypothetical protein [Chloroflexia bacterium]